MNVRRSAWSFTEVPESVQVIRAEFLQEMLRAGIEVHKTNKIRGWLERRMSVPLLDDNNLVRQYITPLVLLEHNTLLDEFKDFIGVMGKFLMDAQYAVTLEPYVNGTPAPILVTKEVDMAVAAPFLLVNPDFSKTEVVKAYAHTIVPPATSDRHCKSY